MAMTGGFHGKTLGALSVTGRPQYRDPFGPLLPQVEFVPFGDLEALTAALAVDPAGSAVLMEPVQAEGGVRVPPAAYLQGVRATCTATGALWSSTRSSPGWAGSVTGGGPTSRASHPTCCSPERSSAEA